MNVSKYMHSALATQLLVTAFHIMACNPSSQPAISRSVSPASIMPELIDPVSTATLVDSLVGNPPPILYYVNDRPRACDEHGNIMAENHSRENAKNVIELFLKKDPDDMIFRRIMDRQFTRRCMVSLFSSENYAKAIAGDHFQVYEIDSSRFGKNQLVKSALRAHQERPIFALSRRFSEDAMRITEPKSKKRDGISVAERVEW